MNTAEYRSEQLSLEMRLQLDRACDAFRASLLRGESPRIEDVCASEHGMNVDNLFQALLEEELSWLRKQGKQPAELAYRQRFPNKGTIIGKVFQSPVSTVVENKTPIQGTSHKIEDVSRFRIMRLHARGGLGEVFLAEDQELGREVALKEIRPEYAGDANSRSRFLQEAEVTGRLEHPGIVPVYGLGRHHDGRLFYAMRLIKGETFKDAVERHHAESSGQPYSTGRMLAFRELLGRFVTVCNAVGYAHSRRILHRDIKPGNIMLGKYGETLLVDWGLAKAIEAPTTITPDEQSLRPRLSDSVATQMGAAVGTPAFMSPEQAGGRLDLLGPVSDIYSLGATLYFLLTGRAPFTTENIYEAVYKAQQGDFRQPRHICNGVPGPLNAIVMKAMATKGEDRYQTCAALAEDIGHWLADEPVGAWQEPKSAKLRRWLGHRRTLAVGIAATLIVGVVSLGIAAVLLGTAADNLAAVNKDLHASNAAEKKAREEAVANAKEAKQQERLAKANELDANTQRNKAIEQAAAAKLEKDRAEDSLAQSEINNYALRISFAQQEWNASRTKEAWSQLESTPAPIRGWEFEYLRSLFDKYRLILPDKTGSIFPLAVSPDGQWVVCSTSGDTIELRALPEGHPRWSSKGHRGDVRYVVFSSNSKRFAGIYWDNAVGVWDVGVDSGPLLFLEKYDSHEVALSNSGNLLAIGGNDKDVRLWNLDTKKGPSILRGHEHRIDGFAFNPDDSQLASAAHDYTVRLWDMNTDKEVKVLRGHKHGVRPVSYSPDGRWLASGSHDRTVRLWDLKGEDEPKLLEGHTEDIQVVRFSPCGKYLVSASSDKTARIWDVKSGQTRFVLTGHAYEVTHVVLSRDGEKVASMSPDGIVRVWSLDAGRELFVGKGHTSYVKSIVFSGDGRSVYTTTGDRKIHRLPIDGSSSPVAVPKLEYLLSVAFSPDGNQVAIGAMYDQPRLRQWRKGEEVLLDKGFMAGNSSFAYSGDGNWLAGVSMDGSLGLWEPGKETKPVFLNRVHTEPVDCVAISKDGKWLASGSRDRTIRIWNREKNGEDSVVLQGHANRVLAVAFSPDGNTLASGGADATVRLWDLKGRRQPVILKGHGNGVSAVEFSPDGKYLASASFDSTVRLWDLEKDNEKEKLVLKGHTSMVWTIAFSPDGRRLASGGTDRTVQVWDVGRGVVTLMHRTSNVVKTVAFRGDPLSLAIATGDGKVELLETTKNPDEAPQ